ncbi:hypothetical protein GCM10027184_53950 [Saccharothrix stipae]
MREVLDWNGPASSVTAPRGNACADTPVSGLAAAAAGAAAAGVAERAGRAVVEATTAPARSTARRDGVGRDMVVTFRGRGPAPPVRGPGAPAFAQRP